VGHIFTLDGLTLGALRRYTVDRSKHFGIGTLLGCTVGLGAFSVDVRSDSAMLDESLNMPE